jgi:hypothetical protein
MFFLLQNAKPKVGASDCERQRCLASNASRVDRLGNEIFLVSWSGDAGKLISSESNARIKGESHVEPDSV